MIKILVVFQNDMMLHAFESAADAERYRDEVKAKTKDISKNRIYIEHIWLTMANEKYNDNIR